MEHDIEIHDCWHCDGTGWFQLCDADGNVLPEVHECRSCGGEGVIETLVTI